MKISKEAYATLETSILGVLKSHGHTPETVTAWYHSKGFTSKRCRWDTIRAAGNLWGPLYDQGLNDDHIDTALRKILGHPKAL